MRVYSSRHLGKTQTLNPAQLAIAPGFCIWLHGNTMRRKSTLSPRQLEIVRAISRGKVDKEIAEQLGISRFTVVGHVRVLLLKLNARTRAEAAVKWVSGYRAS
jgi:DNA-binding NarL/FixJ family response regulator